MSSIGTNKKQFIVDALRCTGCQLCVIACKDEHVGNGYPPWTMPQPDTGHFWIRVPTIERGQIPRVSVRHLPLFCQHCDNAPCIKVCPEEAIRKRDDGLVWIDPEKCKGCQLCQEACPYDVIYFNEDLGIAQKCTGCVHRVEKGDPPRCVEICPHDAILFGDEEREGMEKEAFELLHPEYEAKPRVYWKGLPKPYIAGTVIDSEEGEVIAQARVAVVDLFNDRSFSAWTDAFGDFWIRDLEEHHKYKVEIEKENYKKVVRVVTTNLVCDLGEVHVTRVSRRES